MTHEALRNLKLQRNEPVLVILYEWKPVVMRFWDYEQEGIFIGSMWIRASEIESVGRLTEAQYQCLKALGGDLHLDWQV